MVSHFGTRTAKKPSALFSMFDGEMPTYLYYS